MEMIQIINHPHPVLPAVGVESRAHAWKAGETIRELLIRQGLDTHQEITIILNDRLLTVEEWDTVCPQPNDLINVKAVVSGGSSEDGGGSNVGQVVMLIVTIVIAIYAPELLVGYGGSAFGSVSATGAVSLSGYGIAAMAVITMGAGMLVSAIFSPSGRGLSNANGLDVSGRDTPNYSLSGGSNSLRPYEPMPVIMGTHRIFPDYGAKPYTEYSGEDQYLYQIFNFGLSDAVITDLKIGETPLSNYEDVYVYWGDANGRISGFPGNVDTEQGAQLILGAGWTQRTTSPNTTSIAVDVEGIVYYQGDTGLLPCAATIEAYYSVTGSGAWQPMAARNVSSTTTGYWSLRTTETVKVFSTGGESGVTTQTIEVQHAASSTGHTEGELQLVRDAYPSLDENGLAITVPAVYGTWKWTLFTYADELIIQPNQFTYSPRFSHPDPITTWSIAYDLDVNHGASQKAQRNTLKIEVPAGQYDVRVRLTNVRSAKGDIADGDTKGGYQYNFSVLKSYQEDPAKYAGQTRMGLVIKASGQLNGVVQRLSALVSAYCSYWDGSTWRYGPTSNNAWWFLDFARGRSNADGAKRYGCHLSNDQIDIQALIAWGTFCDAEGLSCNMILDRSQSAWDTLNTIAKTGFASVTYASGKLGVIWDKKNASPVAAFGMSNIIKGSFSIQYVTENLADEIVVSFVDSTRDWQQDQVRVLSPGVTSPTRSSTVELMGCTNAPMAGKFANYLAAQQVYRKRMISWESDFEGFTCQRGDVVILSHDLTQWGYSGRLVNVAGSVLTLERKVPRSGSEEYLMVAFPNGNLTTYTVTAGTGDQDVVTLTSPLTLQADYAAVDHRWFFSPMPTPGKKVKIVSVRPVSQSRVAIVATDEDPEFYAAWDGTFTQPAQQTLLTNALPVINSLDISESLFAVNSGSISNRVTVAAKITGAYDDIYWRWRFTGSNWTATTTELPTLSFDTPEVGQIEVSASARSGLFFGTSCTEIQQILGETVPPYDVKNFQARIVGSSMWLTYTPTTEVDVMVGGGGVIIKHSSATSGAIWQSASVIYQGPAPISGVSVPAMVGTYLAKFIDATGHESNNAASVVNEISLSLIAMNVVDTLNDAPGWAGTHSSTRYDVPTTSIILDSLVFVDSAASFDAIADVDRYGGMALSGTYTLADTVDIGVADTCRISGAISFVCADAGIYIDQIADFDSFPDVDGVVTSGASAKIQVALSQDGTNFGPWADLYAGEAKFRKIKARVLLESTMPNINVRVTAATVTVDMPDRVEDGNDIVSGAAAYAVTYTRQFQTSPSLAITAQNMATGDYYVISAKSVSGFTVTFKNSAGTNVSRTFDFVAKGY